MTVSRGSTNKSPWRDKLATNTFCYHGDHFKQTRFSTGETQERMDR